MHHKVGRMVIGRYETHLWRAYTIAALLIAVVVWATSALLVHSNAPETLPLSKGEMEGVRPANASASAPTDLLVYTVQPGDTLVSIAKRHRVSWYVLWAINREMLMMNVEDHCSGLSLAYTRREGRRGHFCNQLRFGADGTPLVFVNTVKPGDLIVVPNL